MDPRLRGDDAPWSTGIAADLFRGDEADYAPANLQPAGATMPGISLGLAWPVIAAASIVSSAWRAPM